MSSQVLDARTRQPSEVSQTERLLVTRRNTAGRYSPLGYLEEHHGWYEFVYLRAATATPGFVPLPGFSEPRRRYRATYLFPLFAERVMSPRRPDRPRWLRTLDLDSDADAMEVLARSSGQRHGDTIEVFRVPRVDSEGELRAGFLVHGVRHMDPDPSREIAALKRGEDLTLMVDSANKHDPRAVVVSSHRGTQLGFVPAPLAGFVRDLCAVTTPRVTVQVANGPDVIPHLRLLVALSASVPASYSPLSGQEWEPVVPLTSDLREPPQEGA